MPNNDWEMVPDIENFINEEGNHQVRIIFPDYTVDLIETEVDAEQEGHIITDTGVK